MTKDSDHELDSSSFQHLEVHYKDWHAKSVHVTNAQGQMLCSSNGEGYGCSSSSVNFTTGSASPLAKSKCSTLTSKIDFEMLKDAKSDTFEMHNSAGILGGSPRYTSPAFEGQLLRWHNKAMSNAIVYTLVDEKDNVIAKFRSDRKTKVGSLDVVNGIDGSKLDEVLVGVVTLLLRKLRSIEASIVVAAVS